MPKLGKVTLLLAVLMLLATSSVMASQCVSCHTDIEKLKAVAKTIPKEVGSAETAGKG